MSFFTHWKPIDVEARNAKVASDIQRILGQDGAGERPAHDDERPVLPSPQAEREVGHGGLQEEICRWCAAQWPPWEIIQARPDKKSTIKEGVHDLTIYADGGRRFNIECKAKGKKPSPKQREWAARLRKLGHEVHTVWSLAKFLEITATLTNK